MALEPIFEADFSQQSFGFRPNRCTMDAIRHLMSFTKEHTKYFWAIEGDISAYFDTIHHRKLMKLVGRRVKDAGLLDLIWKFLRAGVMERKLFKDTRLGTPQGGIVSPLLANVYLHELDKYMRRYTALSDREKRQRRRRGLPNFVYARYADDFVILCNGTKEHALALREELHSFLSSSLCLSLSLEKTKVTHLNDGFDFLGFRLRRSMGAEGMGVKTTIADSAMRRHLDYLRAATALDRTDDAIAAKILALNRAIAGWCRYFQYTSRASAQFHQMEHRTFWMVAHWLARKYKLSMPQTLCRFKRDGGLGTEDSLLLRHSSFPTLSYRGWCPV